MKLHVCCAEQVSINRFLPEIQLCSVKLDQNQSYNAPPPPPRLTYEESRRLHRQSRQSWQKLYNNIKNTRPIHLSWRWETFSYEGKSKRGWRAIAWTRTPSRTPGRGVTRSLSAVNFAAAFRSCLERCKKCVGLSGEFLEKS